MHFYSYPVFLFMIFILFLLFLILSHVDSAGYDFHYFILIHYSVVLLASFVLLILLIIIAVVKLLNLFTYFIQVTLYNQQKYN